MARFLDVSFRYATQVLDGHFASFHASLAAAATAAGHTFEIATARGEAAREPILTHRLDSENWDLVVEQLDELLDASTPSIVLVYEGRIAAIEPLKRLARRSPDHVFLLNLFKPEHPLNLPDPRRARRAQRFAVPDFAALGQGVPGNLKLLADTDRRALVGRGLGLPISATWPLHTALASPHGSTDAVEPDLNEVLIAMSEWQLRRYPWTMPEVDRALKVSGRDVPSLSFSVLGHQPNGSRGRGGRSRRWRRIAEVASGALASDAYAARIAAAGVVWLPTQGLYTGQSSGKAIDALVLGRPILVPSGTYGSIVQERYVPGAPSYRTQDELIELIGRLPMIIGHWSEATRARRADVAADFSAARAILVLESIAAGHDGEGRGE